MNCLLSVTVGEGRGIAGPVLEKPPLGWTGNRIVLCYAAQKDATRNSLFPFSLFPPLDMISQKTLICVPRERPFFPRPQRRGIFGSQNGCGVREFEIWRPLWIIHSSSIPTWPTNRKHIHGIHGWRSRNDLVTFKFCDKLVTFKFWGEISYI